jgi:Na+/phosphate symporter
MLVFLTSQVVTSLKVLTQLMVGYVISFGHKVAKIQSYGSALSAYGLIFLGAHFVCVLFNVLIQWSWLLARIN